MKATVHAVRVSNMVKTKRYQIKNEDSSENNVNHDNDKELNPREALRITPELEAEAKEAMKIKGFYLFIYLFIYYVLLFVFC